MSLHLGLPLGRWRDSTREQGVFETVMASRGRWVGSRPISLENTVKAVCNRCTIQFHEAGRPGPATSQGTTAAIGQFVALG